MIPGEIVEENTGTHPTQAFIQTLRMNNFSWDKIEEIYSKYNLGTKEYVKRNKRKEQLEYKAVYTTPYQYKKTLERLGIPVQQIPYWRDLQIYMKRIK